MDERYKINSQNIFPTDMSGINISMIFGIPIIAIIVGELLILSGQMYFGLGIHMINLLAIIFMIIFSSLKLEKKNILQSLTLIILIRVISLSVPGFFTVAIAQYSLIYGVMYIPIYLTIKNQNISSKDLGMSAHRYYIYLPIAVMVGSIIALVGYKILNLEPINLIETIRLKDIILISTIMLVFISPVEEIIFRSVLQTRLEKMFNYPWCILLSAGLFGVMHLNGMEIFATFLGIVNGYIFYKTRSLPFIITTSGIANIMLFGILPNL